MFKKFVLVLVSSSFALALSAAERKPTNGIDVPYTDVHGCAALRSETFYPG